ncbi:hypothetical protein [Urechidicola croceus]|uniref:Uncharacterized protein n=1 Tax=Urechidicola croceus TaxID=1850246 RepID=A0A1D8PB01_9FLAO|nr:hypothetical protein [Urechidicola croceus]AOW21752.1 hypothetical protein LPB138_14160 [Urechidicola croceus]
MTEFIFNIGNIAGGILLGLATLDRWDGDRNFFNKIAGFLAPFQTIIGGILLGFGILYLMGNGNKLYNVVSVLGGFLLLAHVLGKVPALGSALQKLSQKLIPFKATIGIALIVVGVLGLL